MGAVSGKIRIFAVKMNKQDESQILYTLPDRVGPANGC